MRAVYNDKGEIIAAEPDRCPDCHRSHCACCFHGVPPDLHCPQCADDDEDSCSECGEDWEDCECDSDDLDAWYEGETIE